MTNIGIPRGTRLEHITRVSDGWHVWFAVKDKSQVYSQWRGSYLYCRDDGSVTRVTVHPDGSESMMEVKP